MARDGVRTILQKKPEEKVPEKEFSVTSPSSSTSACNRRAWKQAGCVKRQAGEEEEEEAPNIEEPNSKTSSSRHLLVLLRRHSTILRHRPFNRRDIRSCCFCCFCCCSCTCIDSVTQRSVPPSMATGKDPMVSSIASKKNYLDPKADSATRSTGAEARPDGEPLPSLEEIRSWGESFDRLMRCQAGRELFREFLQCEYSEENILFWCACEDLKRECNPEIIEEKARTIYENYVSILSPKEVSLDSKVRDIVNEKMICPTANTFDEAQLQIYTLMHRDSYPRFLGSSMYRRVAQLSPTSRKTSVSVH